MKYTQVFLSKYKYSALVNLNPVDIFIVTSVRNSTGELTKSDR